jgi:ribonuclease HI
MELMAPIEALRLATSQHPPVPKQSYSKIVVYADSLLVVNGIGAAESTWPQRGWLTTENEPVLSADLWQELLSLKRKAGRVEFRHVKGHKTNPYNNKVDKLAKAAADLTLVTRRQEKMVARKISPRQTVPRVVPMRGQTETIRIVAVRAIRGQPHHAYKYEVVRDESPNYRDVDDAFAMNDKVAMRRAHIYEVRFADEGHRGRWIEEVVREIPRDQFQQ